MELFPVNLINILWQYNTACPAAGWCGAGRGERSGLSPDGARYTAIEGKEQEEEEAG